MNLHKPRCIAILLSKVHNVALLLVLIIDILVRGEISQMLKSLKAVKKNC